MKKALKSRLCSWIASARKPAGKCRPTSRLRFESLESRIVLTTFNGTELERRRDLGEALAPFAWGDAATLSLTREGAEQQLTVLLRR